MSKHGAHYTPEQLAYFHEARFVAARQACSPRQCTANATLCWVADGPPAINTHATCLTCKGKVLPQWAGSYRV